MMEGSKAPAKNSVLDILNSGIHWKDALQCKKILFHQEQEVNVIVKNDNVIICKFVDNIEDEIVLDIVKEEFAVSDVKRMLDKGLNTSEMCTIGNAVFVRDTASIGDERVRRIIQYVNEMG